MHMPCKFNLVFPTGFQCVLLSSLILSGCDSSVRREGFGGGALSPVKVTLLREAGSGDEEAQSESTAGPKITEFGTLSGRITVSGSIPTLAPLLAQGAATKDAICSAEAVPNQTVVGSDGGLGNVFVYLRRVPNVDVPAPKEEPVVFDQKGCVFVPHAQVVQTGQKVILKNSDPVAHNVNVKGFAGSFNSTVPPNNQSDVETTFSAAEKVPAGVICDFHNWMQAYVFPVDHPWATTSNPDGSFTIENVPAGKMEFVIWHEKLGYIERSVEVEIPAGGESAPLELSVDAADLAG
ncbi:hypothetical protein KOR42_06730 [Thalassoglobus neptunius]|uniref:Rhamnogalacturonan lyase domain-containing protein n=2 Tax=Thalassoglobus neptunius TaxID=1938619 RepID=A0A5C5X4Z7_9PLAN|nr:hypothetical protein KOR42_06730 [Thalassoglobus neptunius]